MKLRVTEGPCHLTGDLNLKENKDFSLFMRIVVRWHKDEMGRTLAQIPHHGSSTIYNRGFATEDFGVCFVNFNST